MEYCALILAGSLPAVWMVVGIVLVLLLLIVSILYVLKLREAAFLKKEVMDLRDTMRMMRYEEASLARMLHVASKPSVEVGASEVSKETEVPTEPGVSEVTEITETAEGAVVTIDSEAVLPVAVMALEEDRVAGLSEESRLPEETGAPNGFEFSEEPQTEEGETLSLEEEIDATEKEIVAEAETTDVGEAETIAEVGEAGAEIEVETGNEDGAEAEEAEPEEADTVSEVSDAEENMVEEASPVEEVVIEEEEEALSPAEELGEVGPHAEEEKEAEGKSVTSAEELPTPTQPVTRKQPINERRPAIPTDLFAAWFAENDDEVDLEEQKDVMTEVPVDETVVATSVSAPATTPVASSDVQAEPALKDVAGSQESDTIPVAVAEGGAEAAASMVEPSDESAVGPANVISEETMGKDDIKFCRKLERIVSTRMRNPDLNIDIIAAQLGFGRTNFYRKVRELMGMSPNDYLRKCRMERAAALLRTTDTAISDVCAQVGIPDAQYFSRVFKTFYGTTPSLYREKNSEK